MDNSPEFFDLIRFIDERLGRAEPPTEEDRYNTKLIDLLQRIEQHYAERGVLEWICDQAEQLPDDE